MLEIPLIQIKSNVFIKNQIKVHWINVKEVIKLRIIKIVLNYIKNRKVLKQTKLRRLNNRQEVRKILQSL